MPHDQTGASSPLIVSSNEGSQSPCALKKQYANLHRRIWSELPIIQILCVSKQPYIEKME